MSGLTNVYDRVRVRTGNMGVIVIGVGLTILSYFIRTDVFEAILDIVGLVGILAGLVITAAGIYWLGDEKGWWDTLKAGDRAEPRVRLTASPALFLLVLLFFTLPWMTIKCDGEDVVTVSGLDMVALEETVISTPAGRDTLSPEFSDAIFVYLAALLAVAGIVLIFVPMHRDAKRYTRAAIAVLGLLALSGFWVQMMLRVDAETEGLASVSMEYGFFLSALSFVAALALQFVPMTVPFTEVPEASPDD